MQINCEKVNLRNSIYLHFGQYDMYLERRLLAAASQHDVSKIEMLLEEGALVNIINKKGESPLHLTMSKADISHLCETNLDSVRAEIVKILLAHGACLHTKDNFGNTPLHAAVEYSVNPSIIECLLDKDAPVNVKNMEGATPLHIAVKLSSSLITIEKLLDKGAIVNVLDKKNRTPLTWAVELRKKRNLHLQAEILQLLFARGAYLRKNYKVLEDSDLPYRFSIDDNWILSKCWQSSDSTIVTNQNFYTILLLAGTKPLYGEIPTTLNSIALAIEAVVKSWFTQFVPEMDNRQTNWQETIPKVLQALPRLLHFVKRLKSKTALSLKPGYTVNSLKAFLFLSDQTYHNQPSLEVLQLNWFIFKGVPPHPLLILKALAERQLPVELIMMIRENLADQAMVATLVSDYGFDSLLARQFIVNISAKSQEVITFYQRLFTHDWSKPSQSFAI